MKGVSSDHRPVRRVGELESSHGIESNYSNPVCDECVFPALGGQHSAVGMRDDPGAQPAEDCGSEMMVWVVVREHDPFHRLLCDRTNRPEKVFRLPRAGQRVDDHDT
jgi:hypothetical protein